MALRAVFGQDEANHGTARYRVDGERLVHVPPEVAAFLVRKAGFALANASAAVGAKAQPAVGDPSCLVRLHHDDAGGCSYGGCIYPRDEHGDVLVPAKAAADLLAHGYVSVLEGVSRSCPGPVRKSDEVKNHVPGAELLAVVRVKGG
jgi:hypothetical protein